MNFICGRELITVFFFMISCKILATFGVGNLHTILMDNFDFHGNKWSEKPSFLSELQN